MLSSHLVAEIIKSKANLNSNFGVNIDLQHESYDYAVVRKRTDLVLWNNEIKWKRTSYQAQEEIQLKEIP